MANVVARRVTGLPAFRRIALGTWGDPADPSIYGVMRIRMEPALAYIAEARHRTGLHITVTHLVILALAKALRACPQANVLIRRGNLFQRQSIDISTLVFTGDENHPDLSAAKLVGVDRMDVPDVANELEAQASDIRSGKNLALEQTRRALLRVPGVLMRTLLKLITFATHTLNLDLSGVGLPKDTFGSAVVTSLGSLGIDMALVPLVSYSRVPIILAPGAVVDEPVVQGDKVVPGKIMTLSATFDHRMIDGAHAASLATTLRQVLENPQLWLPVRPQTETLSR